MNYAVSLCRYAMSLCRYVFMLCRYAFMHPTVDTLRKKDVLNTEVANYIM